MQQHILMYSGTPSFSLLFWMASTGVLTITYPIVARTFPFRATISRDYKAVNVVKGSVLALMTPAAATLAVVSLGDSKEEWVAGLWQGWLPAMAAIYAALDLSALVFYPSSAITTRVHHALVQLFYLYLEWINFEYSLAARAIVLYAGVSTCEFIVNLRLALRGAIIGPAAVQLNRKTLRVYLVGTYINLVGQVYLVWNAVATGGWGVVPLEYWLVAAAMAGVFVDDVYLILYLWRWRPQRGGGISRARKVLKRRRPETETYAVPSLAALASRSATVE